MAPRAGPRHQRNKKEKAVVAYQEEQQQIFQAPSGLSKCPADSRRFLCRVRSLH